MEKNRQLDPEEEGSNQEKSKKTNSSTPILDNFGKDLTKLASLGKLDPVIGREQEIDQTIEILNKRKKNNPILIGEPGVGKTAIAEGLALRIFQKKVDRSLLNKKIIELNMASMVSNTKFRGEFESRMESLIREIQKNPDVIIFIDEIHNIIGAGGASGSLDAANIIKPALARGEMRCIGATTMDEYKKVIETDSALERRFQKVFISIPTKEETIQILNQIKSKYEDFHGVTYSDEVIKGCVEISDRYIVDRNFPDKAIDLMDEVGSSVKLQKIRPPEALIHLEVEMSELMEQKDIAAKKQDYESAAIYRDKQRNILALIEQENVKWKIHLKNFKIPVELEDVARVVSNHTGVPLNKLTGSENDKLVNLDKLLKNKIIGQDDAVDKIVDAIQRSRLGIQDPEKPIASFMFLGTTGTGKTYLAKTLAQFMFDTDESFIRFDMSEYMDKVSVNKLIGAPPGYVGYEEKGILTEKVKNRPYSILLFDEIEKAHPDVFNILLQILDEGKLSDSTGKEFNFKNTIIILTSNIGTDKILSEKRLGFTSSSSNYDVTDMVMEELKKHFKPELINRIDEKVVFKTINDDDVIKIVELELVKLIKRLQEKNYKLSINVAVKKFLANVGYDRNYGARPLKRAITSYIETPIAKFLLNEKPIEGSTLKLTMDKKDDVIIIKI